MDEGTYVIGISSLSTSASKFDVRGLGKQENKNALNLIPSPCLKAQYTYFIGSMTSDSHAVTMSFADLIYNLFTGELFSGLDKRSSQYDQQIRGDLKGANFLKCRYDDYPTMIQSSEAGFDMTYALKMPKKNFEVIDIVASDDQLMRVFVNSNNPKNNINVFLYQNGQMNNLLAYTENSKFNKNFLTTLKA